jgi:hypothetical protein
MSTFFPIVVYGDGPLYREYFNAIAAFFGTSTFNSLFNLSLLLASFTACYSYITKRKLLVLFKWFGLFYVAFYLIFVPRTTVTIIDRINGDMGYTVDHIPLGLAALASYTSLLDDALTRSLESNFTEPDYMPYHETGMIFASRLMTMANQFEINDAEFDSNLKEFIHQCVFYDILLNKYSIDDLLNADNLWQFVTANASPARAFMYNGHVTVCKDGATSLSNDWQKVLDDSINDYSQRLYPNLSKEKAKAQFTIDLPMSYRYLTSVSAGASEIMRQNLMANAIQRGVVGLGAKLDASAALESYTFARAEEQKRLTNKTTGEMAAEWFAKWKIAVETVLYASFIFVVLLSVFPFGAMVLRNYFLSMLWIHLWAPMYAIINLIISYDAQSKSNAATHGALSLKAMSGLLQINSDIAGLAGTLSMAVPFLVSGIVFGMHKVLSQGIQSDQGIMQSAIGSGVNEAVSGNISLGNTNFGNQHMNNVSTNHVDTNARVSSGMMTSQLAGGSLLTTAADGSHIMDMRGSLSSGGASINLMDGLRNSYSNQVEKAESAAFSDNLSYGRATNAALRSMNDLSEQLGKARSSGESWTTTASAGTVEAINDNAKIVHDYASRHHISDHEAANVLGSAYLDERASVSLGAKVFGTGIGGSVSGGRSTSATHTSGTDKGANYSDAQSYLKDTNYAKNVDVISRAAKDHSLRFNNDEANRLVNSMGASFEKADSARSDMQSHYQEAESARLNASRVEEHAATIQVNAAQEYNRWIENQPGTNGHGKMGARSIEAINKDPHLSEYYANQFIEQYKSKLDSNWNHGMPTSKEGIHKIALANNQKVPTNASIDGTYHSHVDEIKKKANQEGLDSKTLIDTSAKDEANQMLSEHQGNISARKESIAHQGNQQKTNVLKEESIKRSGSLGHDFWYGINTKNNQQEVTDDTE